MPFQPPSREYRTWAFDSRRWNEYRPRPDHIIISTYPKCGTTWTQRIVQMLVFGSPASLPLSSVSGWPDWRGGEAVETAIGAIEAQTHRRFLKAHLPFDGLPFYDEIRYLHVARDGCDACLSFHNHALNLMEATLARMDAVASPMKPSRVPIRSLSKIRPTISIAG